MEVPPDYPVRPIDPSLLVTPEIPPQPLHVHKKKKKKKKHWEEEDDIKKKYCGLTIRSWVLSIMWVISFTLLVAYLFVSITNWVTEDPSTVSTLDLLDNATVPALTVCNWNTEGDYPNFPKPCSICQVKNISCYIADERCSEEILARTADVVYTAEGATFHCFQFNFNQSSLLSTKETGYAGHFSFLFEIEAPNLTTPNARIGLQVTFHLNDQIPDVFGETNFVLANTEGSFSLTQTRTVYDNTSDLPDVLGYSVSFSSIGLAGDSFFNISPNGVRVKVGFDFDSLDRDVLTFQYTYTRAKLLGDLSGIIGLLIGLDFIKFARGIVALTKFKAKGITPFITVWNT